MACRLLVTGTRTEPFVSNYLAILMPKTPPSIPKYPEANRTDVARTEVDTVKTGLEFKGPSRAGTALIFGRGVKTLTFTLHSKALPLHLLKDREEVHTVCTG